MSAQGKRYSATEKAELVAEIAKQHSARIPVQQIAKSLGLHHQTVYTWLQQYYERISAPLVEAEFNKDLLLLEQAIELAWKRIKAPGNAATFGDLEKLLARRAKMIGYEAALKLDATVKHTTPLDSSISNLLSTMEELDRVVES